MRSQIASAAGTIALLTLLTCGARGQMSPPSATHENSSATGSTLAELSLQELLQVRYDKVYSASRREQSLRDAPASVSIISADDIKVHGYRSLAEILQSAPGLYVTYDRAYHYLGMRGFNRPGDYNSRVLLLVDGHRMNDNLYSMAMLEADYMSSVDLIERVEVVNGPASSLYGDNAFFGVVNVVTKRGAQLNGFEVASEYGSFDAWKGRLSYGVRTAGGLDLLLSGSYFDRAGPDRLYFPEYDKPGENYGVAERLDFERAGTFQARASYGDFTVSGAFTRREKSDPAAAYNTVFSDPRNLNLDLTAFAELKYEHTFENEVQLTSRLAWHHYGYDATLPYDYAVPPGPPDIVLEHERDVGEWWGGDVQLRREFWDRLTVIFGGEARHNYRQDLTYYSDADPDTLQLDVRRESLIVGAFAQGDLRLGSDLNLSAGLRYDRDETFGDSLNPRVGLIYHPWAPTTFKALYGQAFRAPNVYEAYGDFRSFLKPSHSLQPETVRTYELVWEQQLTDPIAVSLSGYHYDVEDLISAELDPDGLMVFRNVQRVRANGATAGLTGAWTNGWRVAVSYTLQRAVDTETGFELNSSPAHLAKLRARLPLWKNKLFAGPELLYVGGMKTLPGGTVEGYWLANFTLLAENVVKNLDACIGLYNLFDTHYAHPVSGDHRQEAIRQDGLTFRVKLTYRF